MDNTEYRNVATERSGSVSSSLPSGPRPGPGPGVPGPSHPKFAAGVILLIFVLERTAYYAVFSNFYLFLNHRPLSWPTYNAAATLLVFFGISCVSSPVGGLVADFGLGRYWTSILSLIIYIAGYSFLPILSSDSKEVPSICLWKKHEQCDANSSTLNNENDINIYNANKLGSIANDDHPCLDEEPCIWLVYIVLCTIGIGSGWLRAVIVPFGADQVVFNVDSLTLMFYIFQNCRKGLKY